MSSYDKNPRPNLRVQKLTLRRSARASKPKPLFSGDTFLPWRKRENSLPPSSFKDYPSPSLTPASPRTPLASATSEAALKPNKQDLPKSSLSHSTKTERSEFFSFESIKRSCRPLQALDGAEKDMQGKSEMIYYSTWRPRVAPVHAIPERASAEPIIPQPSIREKHSSRDGNKTSSKYIGNVESTCKYAADMFNRTIRSQSTSPEPHLSRKNRLAAKKSRKRILSQAILC